MQDVLVMDIDRDQQEELVLLIWKHGSYGRHLPVWEKKNDIRLEQHIFIYRLQEYPEQNNEYVKAQDEEADKISCCIIHSSTARHWCIHDLFCGSGLG